MHSLLDFEGVNPNALISSGSTLYGTTFKGGLDFGGGYGTAFSVNTDSSGFTVLHTFGTGADGGYPNGLVFSGNTLYGTTGANTLFSISFPPTLPQLTITSAGANVVLTWPTNISAFQLQSARDLGPSAIWSNNLQVPFIIDGLYTVTNPISASKQFFRLSP
jgi:uncharacterized repeat protein (TIGR03803 family)